AKGLLVSLQTSDHASYLLWLRHAGDGILELVLDGSHLADVLVDERCDYVWAIALGHLPRLLDALLRAAQVQLQATIRGRKRHLRVRDEPLRGVRGRMG